MNVEIDKYKFGKFKTMADNGQTIDCLDKKDLIDYFSFYYYLLSKKDNLNNEIIKMEKIVSKEHRLKEEEKNDKSVLSNLLGVVIANIEISIPFTILLMILTIPVGLLAVTLNRMGISFGNILEAIFTSLIEMPYIIYGAITNKISWMEFVTNFQFNADYIEHYYNLIIINKSFIGALLCILLGYFISSLIILLPVTILLSISANKDVQKDRKEQYDNISATNEKLPKIKKELIDVNNYLSILLNIYTTEYDFDREYLSLGYLPQIIEELKIGTVSNLQELVHNMHIYSKVKTIERDIDDIRNKHSNSKFTVKL